MLTAKIILSLASSQLGFSVSDECCAWVINVPTDESASLVWRQNRISWEVKNFGKKKRNLCNINGVVYTVCEHERDRNVPTLQDKCCALEEKRYQCIWSKANEYGLGVMALNFHIFSQISGFVKFFSFSTIFGTGENIRKNYHTYRTRLSSVASEPCSWS